jgi:hypothetical protein
MQERQRAVRIDMHLHAATDIMMPERALWHLQPPAVPGHRVVAADRALLLDTERLHQLCPLDGDEAAVGQRRSSRETGIVLGQVDLGDPAVRRLNLRDPG